MFKQDAREAAPILQRALTSLLAWAPAQGRSGSDLRTACGDLRLRAEALIQADAAGKPLANCFTLALATGITQPQLAQVRSTVEDDPTPKTVGAAMIKNAIINLCIASECQLIASMEFVSREDVDTLKQAMNTTFGEVEEIAADEMDQMTYRALTMLHAALMFHLVETARPLPRMLRFRFATPMPTLIVAQRLYYDASRADELRAENKVVHPAFELPTGRALGA